MRDGSASVDRPLRLASYLATVAAALTHASRRSALMAYCTALLLPGRRKSVELLAARIAPDRVGAVHQSLHHFVANAAWDEAAVRARALSICVPALESRGPIEAWIVDSTAWRKQGERSVGTCRQSAGSSGRPMNCQIEVTLSLANRFATLPVSTQLFLPAAWANDVTRRRDAGVPEAIAFMTTCDIALALIRAAKSQDLPIGVVVADEEYGASPGFRAGLAKLGLHYAVAVPAQMALQDEAGRLSTAARIAADLPPQAWRRRTRSGVGRIVAVRVGVPAEDGSPADAGRVWLVVEDEGDKSGPARLCLSNLPPGTPPGLLATYANAARLGRSACLKELRRAGLGHFEGRGWRGYHQHATLAMVTYGFLLLERCTQPRSRRFAPHHIGVIPRPLGHRPRASRAGTA